MVCKPEVDDEEQALCVVRDFSGTSQNLKITLHVPNTMNGKEFVQTVANFFNFDPSSFRLVAPTPNKENSMYQAVLTDESEELLKDVGVTFKENARNLFIVEGLNGAVPRLMDTEYLDLNTSAVRLINRDDDLELGASASPEEPSSSNSYSPPLPPPMIDQDDVVTGAYKRYALKLKDGNNTEIIRKKGNDNAEVNRRELLRVKSSHKSADSYYAIGYRGLVNQAMTCYLNSLLQALFMTPEFRNALYNWKFIPSPEVDESKSIPYQLQRLFLNLQTSSRPAVETTDLTRSFGWDSSEAWQQHDIQELCRVMFDALEQEFKGTEQADLINRLYQGKMIDYVKCLECDTEKSREDTFLDIPLPVRPFGSTTAYGSVEEALAAFVQPEVLEGNNQYFCEKCNKKCNAHKGLKFMKFPYLLTLHLMRFDFDYNTMHRIKLSDKVVFPETLNLNSFVPVVNSNASNAYKEDGSEGFLEEITGSSSKCDDSSNADSGSAIDDESCMTSSNDLNNVDYDQDIDEGIDVSNQHENENKNRCQGIESGQYMYELFSIMVHSGSASGGHYYVYIKDFDTSDWICFNDQTVTKITSEDIDRSFGGYGGPSRGYYSGVYSSSMNAYMLMYRQIDRERNVLPLKEHQFPPHLTALLKRMNEKAEMDRRSRVLEKEVFRIKVYVVVPSLNMMIDSKVEYNSNTTLKELTQIAYKKLQLENRVSLEQCRLVLYNKQTDTIEASLEGKENEPLESIFFSSPGASRKIEMLMEIRQFANVPFPIYSDKAVPLKLHLVNVETENVSDVITIRSSLSICLPAFREELYEYEPFKCYRSFIMLLILEMTCNAEKFLEDETESLRTTGVVANSKIFIGFKKTDISLTACRQKMRSIVKRYLNTLTLNIMLPDIQPEVFKKLTIPSLAEYYCNQKQNVEQPQSEKNSCLMNGETNSVQQPSTGNQLTNSTSSTNEEEPSPALLNDLMNFFTTNNVNSLEGNRSDQSTSEDSSLTDSDRTIIGDNQEDYQISSPSSSPQGVECRYTNDLLGEDETSVDNIAKTNMSSYYDDGSNDAQLDNYYFKKLFSSDKKILQVEVDKNMPIKIFKKYLEKHVQVPSLYFKICIDNSAHGEVSSFMNIASSLKNIEDRSTLHVRLERPLRPGTVKRRVYMLNLSNFDHVMKLLGEFNIDENSTVAETKRELLLDLLTIYKIDIPFERCRLRKKSMQAPGEICPNDKTWKELNFGYYELILQKLNLTEPVTNSEALYCIMVRNYVQTSNVPGVLREIVFNEKFTIDELKTKVSEISDIPVENLILGEQSWSNAFNSDSHALATYITNVDIDWKAMNDPSFRDELLILFAENGQILCYKDNREDVNETKTERKLNRRIVAPNPRKEKTLTIRRANFEKSAC